MLGLAEWVFLAQSIAQFLLGLLANGFIGLFNGRGWLKSKRISLYDSIVTTLALSRMVLLWVLLFDGVLILFSPNEHERGIVMKLIDLFWTFTNHLSIWLTTCLGVLYCLKISSFSHPTFLWLKWRVSRVVMWVLLGALLLSLGSTLSLIREFKNYSSITVNMTGDLRDNIHNYKLIHVLGTLWYLPPLVMTLASYCLLLLSLGRHTRQMQYTGAGSGDFSTEAHKRATSIILSFFFLFLLNFLSFSIASSSYFFPKAKLAVMVGEAITMLYAMGHSFILILGNPKMRQAFVRLLRGESGGLKPGSMGPFSS
ncbi:taste receptor type 2 member 3-like [Echinops telfairi]|uniref:Taste receptor type 2 n=1 Tax=Echinops telfairi TaxID=9371 RepID=A0ABM0J3M4_ECHTE|nr:taste receptor type 2 member 3-like [Echinops telfairi]